MSQRSHQSRMHAMDLRQQDKLKVQELRLWVVDDLSYHSIFFLFQAFYISSIPFWFAVFFINL